MKITIDSKVFKKLADAAILIASKSSINGAQMVRFDWSTNQMRILSTNFDEYFEAVMSADSVANDLPFRSVELDYPLLKQIYNTSGNDVTISIDEHGLFNLCSGKKKVSVGSYMVDENSIDKSVSINKDFQDCFEIENYKLIEITSKLDRFRSQTNIKPVLCGFSIDCTEKWIYAIDGYHAAIRQMNDVSFKNNEAKFVVHGGITVMAKKYFNKDSSTIVRFNNKYVQYITDNITYTTRIIEGTPHPIHQAIPTNNRATFEFETDEILSICKDYSKYISEKSPSPIVLFNVENDSKFYIGLQSSRIQVCTETKAKNETGIPIKMGFNNKFTSDCFSVFKGGTCKVSYASELYSLTLENDEYLSLLLPVRLPSQGIGGLVELANKSA